MTFIEAEIGIVGAGPAGARAAELLAGQGAEVLMWDPKAPWEKPCGGGLTWSALRDVPDLRAALPRARRIGRIRVELAPVEGFTVPLDRPMYMMARKDLAKWQLDRARSAGAVHESVAIRSIERATGRWRLEDSDGRRWTVRLLVGADGAASLVRPTTSPGFRVALAPTRVTYPPGPGPTPDTVLVKFYDEVEGYLWDFPRPDHRSVGIGIVAGGWKRRLMDREVDEYRLSLDESGRRPPPRAGAVIGTALFGHGDYAGVGGSDFALLGDAAGFADPATGEGIENALRSAGVLARAYEADRDFSSYPRHARSAFEKEFKVSRLIRKILFRSGLGATLVRRGMTSDWAHATAGALANAVNEHDPAIHRLLGRTLRGFRRVRRDPNAALRRSRSPESRSCGTRQAHKVHEVHDGGGGAGRSVASTHA